MLPRRPDLKVIVTSATIDADRFAKHFAARRRQGPGAGDHQVSGRTCSRWSSATARSRKAATTA
jgi:ATP-dependent helicase HrpA